MFIDEENKKFKSFKLSINDKEQKKLLTDFIYKHRHFENVLLLLIKTNSGDTSYFLDYGCMRAVLTNSLGGKHKVKADYIKQKYKTEPFLIELKKLSKELRIHNIVMLIRRMKKDFKNFFIDLKQGIKSSPPKAKKLKSMNNYSIILDSYAGLSLKRKDKIGINLNKKMFYLNFNHIYLIKLAGSIDNIQSASILYHNAEIYLSFGYIPEEKEKINNIFVKEAGIDLGVNNLWSILVNDKTTPSLLIDGQRFIEYNSNFNRKIAKLNERIASHAISFKEIKGKKYAVKWDLKGCYLKKLKNYLYEKRNLFFENEFNKLSKRFVDYCFKFNINKVCMSYNLAELKNNGNCKLNKSNKQTFIEIPFIKLLHMTEYKCNDSGILVEKLNEAYTSKCSCISDDINNLNLDKGFNGIRSKRGLYKDTKINKTFNADLNGAANHIIKAIGLDMSWLQHNLIKLCNPIKIKSDYDFCRFLQNNVSEKISTERHVEINTLQLEQV